MAALREIIAKFGITFDDAELKKGEAAIAGAVDALKGLVGLAGGALTAKALFSFATATADQAVALDKQARALRMSSEDLQRFQQAAQVAGASSEALDGALEQLRQRSRKPGEALLAVADKLAAIKDPTRRAQIGTMMLGQSYRDLEPMLAKGSKGINSLITQADALGATFNSDTVEAAKSMRAEMGKLNVFWSGLKTQLGAALIPLFTTFSQLIIPLAVGFNKLTRNTQLFKTIAIAVSGFAMFKFIQHTKLLTMSLRTLTSQFLKVIAPILILEDFLVFMAGGKSAFGEILDKAFGKGTADRVRAAIGGIKDKALELFTLIKTEPKKAVEKLLEWFGLDPTSKWRGFFEAFVDTSHGVIDGFTNGWSGAIDFVSSLWETMKATLDLIGTEMILALETVPRAWITMFQEAWNTIVAGAQNTVKLLSRAASAVGASDTAKSLAAAAQDIGDSKVQKTSSERLKEEKQAERIRVSERFEAPWAKKPASTTVNNSPSVVVNLPPGTPEQTANRVANATQKAIQKSNQATYGALVPGKG